ncbi:MAG: oligosaccharide flippase family protein [candidate division WOR-3 bacterium]|nr:oligosaccharide flippase family protein [candidate division WOR-3 bacterium]
MKLKDLKILSKDTIIYGIGNSSRQAIQILLMPLYAYYLPADRFGVRALTVAVFGVLQIISVWALDQAVLADYYKTTNAEERRRVVSSGFSVVAVLSFLWGAICFLAASFLPEVLKFLGSDPAVGLLGLDLAEASHILRLFAVYVAFSPPTAIFLAYLRSERRSVSYSIYAISIAIARVTFMVLALVVFKRGLKGLYEADALLAVCAFPVLAGFVYTYTRGIRISWRSLRSMLGFALPIVPTAAFGWLRNLGDRFFINLYLTTREVGIFSFALNFPNVLNFLLIMPLGLAWAPYIFSIKERPDLPRLFSRVFTYFAFIAGGACVLLGGTAYEILRIVSPRHDYWEGAPLAPLLLFGISIYGLSNVLGTSIAVKRKTVYFTITTFVSAAVSVGVNVLLLPLIGLWASAFALFTSYLTMFIATHLLVKRLITIHFEIRRIVLIGALAIPITLLLSLWHPFSPLLGLIVKLGLGGVSYVGLLLCLGFLLPEEKRVLRSLLKRSSK